MYDIKKRPLGIYEKALPNDFTWLEKMQAAKQAGFDYIEISIDESDERLARLDWSDEQIEEMAEKCVFGRNGHIGFFQPLNKEDIAAILKMAR